MAVVRNQLAAHGFRVTPATSGPEALRLIAERSIDLVILDVMMPRMSGFEVCRRLRERHPLDRLDSAAEKLRLLLDELFELSRVGIQANPPEEVAFGELVRTGELTGEI